MPSSICAAASPTTRFPSPRREQLQRSHFQGDAMKILKGMSFLPVLVLSAALVQSSPAQTLQVLTVGSSAQFGPFAVAAWELARAGNVTAFHYTLKASAPCPGTTCYAWINDSRKVGANTIPPEPGNLWVVWSTNGIWA